MLRVMATTDGVNSVETCHRSNHTAADTMRGKVGTDDALVTALGLAVQAEPERWVSL